jgi:hypothetical protein
VSRCQETTTVSRCQETTIKTIKKQQNLYQTNALKWSQVVMLLIFIRAVPSLNVSWGTNYPDGGLLWVSSVPQGKFQNSTLQGHDHFLPNPFNFIEYDHPLIPFNAK